MSNKQKQQSEDKDPCIVPGCDKIAVASWGKGICRSCYGQARALIERGETTWEELAKLKLCTYTQKPLLAAFYKQKEKQDAKATAQAGSEEESSSTEASRAGNQAGANSINYLQEDVYFTALSEARQTYWREQASFKDYTTAVKRYANFILYREGEVISEISDFFNSQIIDPAKESRPQERLKPVEYFAESAEALPSYTSEEAVSGSVRKFPTGVITSNSPDETGRQARYESERLDGAVIDDA